ncbi:AMP-binding protein [Streptomyces sp. SID10853]|uniref:AMP-binding protein n=1 Tax=Streptomyces sp. SID10853 TaxID=2706028 RepID=UPI0013C1BCBD|nr:AMP-binding protein [Streptomyces sp. SID10853]NDZ83115.1 AMP-binding protein [Streptomyces sp. SID10853]
MLDGFTPWPDEEAAHYRRAGYWQGRTLGGLLRDWARDHSSRTALVHRESRMTYARLNRRVDRMAAGLRLRGIRPGNRVVVQLPNVPDFVITVFALFRTGAIPVFAPVAHRTAEIRRLVRTTKAVGYVGPASYGGFDHAGMAARISDEFPFLRRVFTWSDTGTPAGGFSVSSDGCLSFPLSSIDAPPEPDPPLDAGSVAFFLLSGSPVSGTPMPAPGAPVSTGTAAWHGLIPRTHDDYAYQTRAAGELLGLSRDDVYLAVLPAESNFAFGCPGIVGTLAVGGTVVLIEDPGPAEAFRAIEGERVTFTSVVPGIAAQWLDALPAAAEDLSSLRVIQTGGAPLHPATAERLPPGFGCRLQQVYEMAEGVLTATRLDDTEDTVLGTRGRPVSPADEIRIDAPGPTGELLARGPSTFRGYYKADAHNAARAFTPDGFYCTGEPARLDAHGNLVLLEQELVLQEQEQETSRA